MLKAVDKSGVNLGDYIWVQNCHRDLTIFVAAWVW
jgi:hypothetical protein